MLLFLNVQSVDILKILRGFYKVDELICECGHKVFSFLNVNDRMMFFVCKHCGRQIKINTK